MIALLDRVMLEFARLKARGVSEEDRVRAALAARARAAAAERAADRIVLPPDAELERACALAATSLRLPSGWLSIVTRDEQIVKAGHNLPDGIEVGEPVPLSHSVCAHVAARDRPMRVHDTQREPALRACVVLGGLRAYAGAPVHLDGQAIGTLAVGGPRPQRTTRADERALERIADLVSARVADLT